MADMLGLDPGRVSADSALAHRTARGRVYSTLGAGSCFGEIFLFMSLPRSKSVGARTHMDLYSLHKDAFVRYQGHFPIEAEKFVKVVQERQC